MIGNRYEIEMELGEGGMGTVFKGIDTQTQKPVAIKHLQPKVLKREPDLLERFHREGEALRELNHPNIVKMLDAVDDGDDHYLIMEFVSGGDLTSLLDAGQLSISRILNIALDLSDALTRAHRLQIIHRDLKPANVLIADNGAPLLTDFGVAHMGNKERVTATESVIGTIDYLPPEALSGGDVDARADIWSFGVMLYEMLTNERPFNGNNYSEVILNIIQKPLHDLEELRADAPIALIDLVYRMLEKDPQGRIPSVRLVGAELEAILQGRDTDTETIPRQVIEHQQRFATPTPSPQTHTHNLPAQTTPFVGRESELAEIESLLNDPAIRLVTIVAPGGMGKTRLSLQAAENQVGKFEHGVYFIELAPVSNSAGIVTALAEGLGYQFQGDGRTEKQQVLDFLAGKEILLVMDNWEHVIDSAALATEILNAAPNVQILATSRLRLQQAGESTFHLGGMDFSEWESPEDALQYAAMKLFLNSAKRALPNFALDDSNLKPIAQICSLVQGMPLGIVLAAAWLAMLSIEEIVAEIQQGIDILEADGSDIPERQRSIRAVFDYSWQQMTPPEQLAFMKMSVFRGGFTRDAVQEITGANLRLLMSMVNKSLLRRANDTGRYHTHELLRQYAEEKLQQESQVYHESIQAHATYFANFTDQQGQLLKGSQCKTALNTLDADIENLRIAWHFWIQQGKSTELTKFIDCIWCLYEIRGWYQQAINFYQVAVDKFQNQSDADSQNICAYLRGAQAWFITLIGQPVRGLELAQQSVQSLKDSSYRHHIFVPLSGLNLSAIFMNQIAILDESTKIMQAIAKENQDRWQEAFAAIWISYSELGHQRVEESQLWGERGAEIIDELNNAFGLSVIHGIILGGIAMAIGDIPQAKNHFTIGLEASEDLSYGRVLQITCDSLGTIALIQGDIKEAQSYFLKSLKITSGCGQIREMLGNLRDLSNIYAAQGQADKAVELLAVILNHPANVQNSLFRAESIGAEAEKIRADLAEKLPADVYQSAWERGKNSSPEQIAEEILKSQG